MKNRNIKISVTLNVALFLILLVLAIGLQNQFYHMEEVNCESIMNSDYHASTESVADCYRFNNFPFWNFYFAYYLLWGGLHLILGLILNIFLSESGMWDEDW